MIKRVLVTALFVAGTFFNSFADKQEVITLNDDDHKSEILDYGDFNIFVKLKGIDDNDNIQIAVELENKSDNYTLLLFNMSYDVKTLKRMKIYFDKSLSDKNIHTCQDLHDVIELPRSNKKELIVKKGLLNESIVFRLPIYTAKYKNKKGTKLSLLNWDEEDITVQVQLKPDRDYDMIKEAYDELIKEIHTETFCKNKNHKGESLADLMDKYNGRINELKTKIDSIVNNRRYYPKDKAHKKYMELKEMFDAIDFNVMIVDSCNNDYRTTHKCKYCTLSYEAIYNKLHNYRQDIYSGELTKSKGVLAEVKSLYTCYTKNTKRPKNSKYKSGIEKCYKNIMKP